MTFVGWAAALSLIQKTCLVGGGLLIATVFYLGHKSRKKSF